MRVFCMLELVSRPVLQWFDFNIKCNYRFNAPPEIVQSVKIYYNYMVISLSLYIYVCPLK